MLLLTQLVRTFVILLQRGSNQLKLILFHLCTSWQSQPKCFLMHKTIKLFLLLTTLFAFRTVEDDKNYCNERFHFCIKYPSSFKLKEEAANGDGAIFVSADKKAEIRAYGSLAIEGMDQLEHEFKQASGDVKVTYQAKKANWFVFSGTDKKGNLIYQKTAKKNIDYLGDKNTPVFQTIRLIYPPEQKDQYNACCTVIAKSL